MPDPTCILCGCSEHRPCVGGAVFASVAEATHGHRLVADEELLEAGEACAWLDAVDVGTGFPVPVCSAHAEEELDAANILDVTGVDDAAFAAATGAM